MSEPKARRPRRALGKFARRAGFVTAAGGVLLSMVIAGVLMRLALRDADQRYRSDLGALLVSSCQAALALGDRQLLQDTLEELAPRLGELTSAEALDASGTKVAGWKRVGQGARSAE